MKVASAPRTMKLEAGDQVTVPVESAWWSKINWTAAIGGTSAVLVWFFGSQAGIPQEVQTGIVSAIGGVMGAIVWVQRTWFTTKVTPGSVSA